MLSTIISCITPTYNRVQLLKRAIESTLNQTYPHWEMIIVENDSIDNKKEIVKNPEKEGNVANKSGSNFIPSGFIPVSLKGKENIRTDELWIKEASITGHRFIVTNIQ